MYFRLLKTRNSTRVIPLSKTLLDILRKVKKSSNSQYVISTRTGGMVGTRSYQKTLPQKVEEGKKTKTITVLEAIKSAIKDYSKEGTRLVIISAERDQKHSFKNVLVNSLRENGIIVEKLWD